MRSIRLNLNKLLFLLPLLFVACTREMKPQLVIYGKDVCEHCHMVISDSRFGAQIVTGKGKVFHFDSPNCVHSYLHSHTLGEHEVYFVNSIQKNSWISAKETSFISTPLLRSPMGAGLFSGPTITAKDLLNLALNGVADKKIQNSIETQGVLSWDQLDKDLSAGKFQ